MAPSRSWLAASAAALILVGSAVPLASAQPPKKPAQDEGIRMPSPKKADDSPPTLWAYFAVFIILATVFGANMIPSKRGHQD